MPTLKPSKFSFYDLTDEENVMADWNLFQVARIHNARTNTATAMIDQLLERDNTSEAHLQNQIFLKGKMQAFDELLEGFPAVEDFQEYLRQQEAKQKPQQS